MGCAVAALVVAGCPAPDDVPEELPLHDATGADRDPDRSGEHLLDVSTARPGHRVTWRSGAPAARW